MNGIVNVAASKVFELQQMKDMSKKVGFTINDIVTCSITTAMKKVFKEKGDPQEYLNMIIPANIRFKFYMKREEVKLENKFSAMPLRVPLTDDMENSYSKIRAVTAPLKSSIPGIYATYVASSLGNRLAPRYLIRKFTDSVSMNFTVAYSNTPGPIKSLYFLTDDDDKIRSQWHRAFIVASGMIGFTISCMSFDKSFCVSVTADSGIMDKKTVQQITQLIEDNL